MGTLRADLHSASDETALAAAGKQMHPSLEPGRRGAAACRGFVAAKAVVRAIPPGTDRVSRARFNWSRVALVPATIGGFAIALCGLVDHEQGAARGFSTTTGSESLVFVSDDRCLDYAGCDSVSVFDLSEPRAVFRGPHLSCSPGRLAGSRDLAVAVSQPANGNHNSLQMTTRAGPNNGDWSARLVKSEAAVLVIGGGVALTPDGEEVLVAVSDSGRPPRMSYWPPYSVRKYGVAEMNSGVFGPEDGRVAVGDGVAYEILVAKNGVH